MKTQHVFIGLAMAFSLALSACYDLDKKSTTPSIPMIQMGSIEHAGYQFQLFSRDSLSVGLNTLFIEVKKNGQKVDGLPLSIFPIMDMAMHSHSSPVWEMASSREIETDLFKAEFVATMPSGDSGSWSVILRVGAFADLEPFELAFPVEILPSTRVKVFTASNGTRYILTWIQPEKPKVGSNDLILSLHRRNTMMDFPVVSQLNLEVEPWMPSMDHGSMHNQHPIHDVHGFYKGKVNFNMTGDWEVRFVLKDGETVLHSTAFDVVL